MHGSLALFADFFQSRHGEIPTIRQRKNFQHKADQFVSDLIGSEELCTDNSEIAVLLHTVQGGVVCCKCLHFNVILRDRIVQFRVFIEIIEIQFWT